MVVRMGVEVGEERGGAAAEAGVGWRGTGERRSGRGMWRRLASRVGLGSWVLERMLADGVDMEDVAAGRGEGVLL